MASENVPGLTLTVATGATVTIAVELPDLPSHRAEITAVPAATIVTTPEPSTVAIAVLLER
jgi:hypothetical protein